MFIYICIEKTRHTTFLFLSIHCFMCCLLQQEDRDETSTSHRVSAAVDELGAGSAVTTPRKTTAAVLLISKLCTPAEVMQLALTCSKLLRLSADVTSAADILNNINHWCHKVSVAFHSLLLTTDLNNRFITQSQHYKN